jgi:G protein-coupled receptor Mth (Methuselah protein)
MSISLPFLLATFLVYALVPKLRNTHGKSVMFYVAGLGLAYLCLAIILPNSLESTECKIFGYLSYFGFMLSFFWLNVMCIDIWLAFR